MKKIMPVLFLITVLLGLFGRFNNSWAGTKKVLVLHIIEENWDDLEFRLPLYRGGPPKPITKKEALKYFEEYKEKAVKKDKGISGSLKEGAKSALKSKAGVSSSQVQENMQNSLYIKHEIAYLGKAHYLKETDTFNTAAFRGRAGTERMEFAYFYDSMPKKLSLLFTPKKYSEISKKYFPQSWNDFKEIRFAGDIYIMSVDNVGTLKIKYNNKDYTVKESSIVVLSKEEKTLTRREMMQFREKYFKYYAEAYPWLKPEDYNMYTITSFLERISIPNETFNFGTRVTIINHGVQEIQGE